MNETVSIPTFNFAEIRKQFPTIQQNSVCYLDTGASALKPDSVINAESDFYRHNYANVHRGVYKLSQRATEAYEGVRDQVKSFINANVREEIIFTAGTTAAINLLANTLNVGADDEIILSTMEHHSNIVPWQMLCERVGAKLKIIPIFSDGTLDLQAYNELFTSKTKLVAITHISNVLGTVNPIKEMAAIAHQNNTLILVDGAQAIPRVSVDVRDLDCDFYVFSSHKAYGPTGVGILYGKKHLLDSLPPYQGGGDMILSVSFDKTIYNETPLKFEAGTPNIAGVVGFGAALKFISQIGLEAIYQHEMQITRYAMDKLSNFPGLTVYGKAKNKVGVLSFTLQSAHPHDIGTILDNEGVAVRAGHHCAMPLIEYYHISGTVRASLGIYNDKQDIDRLIAALNKVYEIFGE